MHFDEKSRAVMVHIDGVDEFDARIVIDTNLQSIAIAHRQSHLDDAIDEVRLGALPRQHREMFPASDIPSDGDIN